LIVLSTDPETIFDPSGEKSTDRIKLLCAFAFSVLSSSVAAREAKNHQFRQEKASLGQKRAPESHTLIVLSDDPETIFDPSGEKSTDQMLPLCALAFSVLSSSVAAREARKCQFRQKRGDFGPKRT
jgi:hypothetical protein